jgi:hypothetical protein
MHTLYYRRRTPNPTRTVPTAIRKLCRHRASKRWSALLTQTRSRIGHHFGMRTRRDCCQCSACSTSSELSDRRYGRSSSVLAGELRASFSRSGDSGGTPLL